MSDCSYVEGVISQALLGSAKSTLNLSLLPESLRKSATNIQAHSTDQEHSFFQIAALVFNHHQVNQKLDLNSFSLELMASYQQSTTQQAITKKSSKPSRKSKQGQQNSTSEEDLTDLIQQHSGPMPLKPCKTTQADEQTLQNPAFEFPTAIQQLLPLTAQDNSNCLLYYLLSHLASHPQCFNASSSLFLSSKIRQCKNESEYSDLSELPFSPLMLKELILKTGGPYLRYVLQFSKLSKIDKLLIEQVDRLATPTSFSSVTNSTVVDSDTLSSPKLISSHKEGIDYQTLFHKSTSLDDMCAVLFKLRWSNPDLSRELLPEKLQKITAEQRSHLLKQMQANLSLADEPLLLQLLNEEQDNLFRRIIANLLIGMGSPIYSKRCLEISSKALHFSSDQWNFKEIEFGPECVALGIPQPPSFMSRKAMFKLQLHFLLEGLTWEDLCTLAQAENHKQAIRNWALFDKSEIKSIDTSQLYIMALIGSAIAKTHDLEAERAYIAYAQELIKGKLDYNNRIKIQNVITESMLMDFAYPERLKLVPLHENLGLPYSWLIEKSCHHLNLPELETAWSQAVLQHICRNIKMVDPTYYQEFKTGILAMRLSPQCIFWCEQEIVRLKTILQNKHLKTSQNTSELEIDQIKFNAQAKFYEEQISFLSHLKVLLKLKQHMAEVLQRLGLC